MQFGQNLSDNVDHKYFSIIRFVSKSMHLDQFMKAKRNIKNGDEIYAIAF